MPRLHWRWSIALRIGLKYEMPAWEVPQDAAAFRDWLKEEGASWKEAQAADRPIAPLVFEITGLRENYRPASGGFEV